MSKLDDNFITHYCIGYRERLPPPPPPPPPLEPPIAHIGPQNGATNLDTMDPAIKVRVSYGWDVYEAYHISLLSINN